MGYLELAKIAGIIVLVGIIFGSGYKVAYNNEHRKVLSLELAIEKANVESARILALETQKVANAEAEARELNINLDKAHEQDINTINAYRDMLATSRMRDPNRKPSCSSTLPKSTDSGINKADEEDSSDISEELKRLLRTESARADECAIDKGVLLDFVVTNNCGLKK